MESIALNYIYLSKNHAGGKDQVGLNLLRGFYELNKTRDLSVICFDYSAEVINSIAPDINIISVKSHDTKNELARMGEILYVNSFVIPAIIKKNNIDVLYHLSCNNGLFKLKAHVIMIPHDIKAVSHRDLGSVKIPFHKYYLYRIMYWMDFRHADKIIAISDFDKSEMLQFYPQHEKKIVRIYNPIIIKKLPKKTDSQDKYICAVNLQFHHKNIITLIKAFDLIKDKIDYNLVLIGSVPKRVGYLKDYVAQHNLSDRVKFTGFVSDAQLNELFANARLYVNPTLYEGFGMTAVEAIINEIPTLLSDIPVNREVTKNLCDFYSPPDDEKALANKIIESLNSEVETVEMHRRSDAMIAEYDYLNICRQYLDIFMKGWR